MTPNENQVTKDAAQTRREGGGAQRRCLIQDAKRRQGTPRLLLSSEGDAESHRGDAESHRGRSIKGTF